MRIVNGFMRARRIPLCSSIPNPGCSDFCPHGPWACIPSWPTDVVSGPGLMAAGITPMYAESCTAAVKRILYLPLYEEKKVASRRTSASPRSRIAARGAVADFGFEQPLMKSIL